MRRVCLLGHDFVFIGRPTCNQRQAGACRSRSIGKPRSRKYAGNAVVAEVLVEEHAPLLVGFYTHRDTEISCQSVVYVVAAAVRVSWHNRHVFHWTTGIQLTAGRSRPQRYRVFVQGFVPLLDLEWLYKVSAL